MSAIPLLLLVTPTRAAICYWKEDGPSSNWSDPNNWTRYTNVTSSSLGQGYPGVPQAGDDLYFYEQNQFGSDPDPMNNDLVGLVVNSMTFNGDTITAGDIEWTLSGNPIVITNARTPALQSIRYGLGVFNYYSLDVIVHMNCKLVLATNAVIRVGGCTPATGYDFCPEPGDVARLHLNSGVDLNGHSVTFRGLSVWYPGIGYSKAQFEVGDLSGTGSVLVDLDTDCSLRFDSTSGNSFGGRMVVSGRANSQTVFDVSGGVAVADQLLVNSLGVVEFAKPNQIGDAAHVAITGGAKLRLNSHSDTIGSLALTNAPSDTLPSTLDTGTGTLTLNGNLTARNDHASVIPTILGRLNLSSGPHLITAVGSQYYGLTIPAEIVGAGEFTKRGGAAVLLDHDNSFNGNVEIDDGVLEIRQPFALGSLAGYTAINEGALLLRNVHVGAEQLRANGQGTGGELPGAVLTTIGLCSWAGQVVLNTNLVVTGDLTFLGTIDGPGGLGLFGGGTVQLAGSSPNTFTGPILLRCPLLELNKSPGIKALAGPLIIGGGAIPAVEARWLNTSQCQGAPVILFANGLANLNNLSDTFGPLTFTGGSVQTGTGMLTLNGPTTNHAASSTSLIAGNLSLPAGLREFHVADGGPAVDLQVAANIGGAGNLGKFGPGQLLLSGANTYSGATIIYAGEVVAASPTALGTSASGTAVINGSTLTLTAVNGALTESISIAGAGVDGVSGALNVLGTTTLRNQFPSVFACLDLTTNATVRVAAGVTLTADGFISGNGPLVKTGGGSLVMTNSNPNTYTGETVILGGTVALRKPNGVVSIPGSVTLGPAAASEPAILRFHQSGGLPTSTPTLNANSLLDLNGFNYTISQLKLNDGADVQTGAGTLFCVDFSSIQVGSLNPLGSSASSSISGNLWPPDTASVTFNVASYSPAAPLGLPPELEVSANLIGAPSGSPSTVNKDGFGTARFSGNNATLQARVRVNGGTMVAANATIFGTTTANTGVNNGGRLALEGNFTVVNESLFLNSTNFAALEGRTGAQTWSGPLSLTQSAAIAASQSLNLAMGITGTGALTKRGAGTLTLSGSANNTFAGNTVVESGTLAFAKPYGFQSVPSTLIVGQTGGPTATALYQNHDQVAGNITVIGNGLLNLNGWDEYCGNLSLDQGGDVQTGSGSLYVLGGGGVTVNPGSNTLSTVTGRLGFDAGNRTITVGSGTSQPDAHDLHISAVIFQANPTVNLTKAGPGRARFTGNNTYTGSTTVSAGLLQVDGAQPQSPAIVNGGTLQGTGTVGHVTFSGVSTSVLAPGSSPGLLTCSNLNANAIGGGKLRWELNGSAAGSQYDQLNVRGVVNLTGLALEPSLQFLSAAGQTFQIIANDGTDPVVGTFTGLPQDATLWIGSERFQISYTGGTGNDVVLARLPTPPLVLYFEKLSATNSRCYWSTNYPDYHLEYTYDAAGTNWAAVPRPPVVTGTNFVVTNASLVSRKFYRLSRVPPPFTPAPPHLAIQPAGNGKVRLLWPADDERIFTLQTTTNLLLADWGSAPTASPTITDTHWIATNSITGPNRYYRLYQP